MENRFGFKDFVLTALLLVVGVLVILQMWQADLQHKQVKKLATDVSNLSTSSASVQRTISTIEQQNEKLSRELADLAARGITVASTSPTGLPAGPTNITQPAPADPFKHLKAARAKPDFEQGDWYIENFGTRVGKITPIISSDIYGTIIQCRVAESLLTRDPYTLEYVPLLAESFSVAPDGLSVTYKLRRGLVFSDGAPLTSADVVFTIDRIMDPILDAARERSYLIENGVKVEAIDDYTVKFSLSRPYFEILNITGSMLILPKHFYGNYTAAQMNDNPGLLMGSGPYRMQSPDGWRPGQPIILVRNERYWGTPPTFDRIVYNEVQEEAASAVMLRNGKIDLLPATPEQFDQLKKDPSITAKANSYIYDNPYGGYTYVAWNQKKADKPTPFADARVRRAVTMLIDRERIAKELYLGYAQPATGPFTPNNPQADSAIVALPYDPALARKLLEEAGYLDRDGDGILEDASGTPFAFEFIFPSASEFTARVCSFIKDNLALGGIKADIKPIDWPTLVQRLEKSQFEAATLGWSSSIESDLFQIFHSSQIADGGDNRTNYISKELDKYIELARSTVDRDQRMKYWNKCHQIIHEEQPYTFLVNRKALRFVDKRIQNIEPAKTGLNYAPLQVMPLPWYTAKGQIRYTN